MKRESILGLRNQHRKQTTRQHACARRLFRFSGRNDDDDNNEDDDELRMRCIHSQYLCPHWTKNRTLDAAIYIDCSQLSAGTNARPLAGEKRSRAGDPETRLADLKQPSFDADGFVRQTSLGSQVKGVFFGANSRSEANAKSDCASSSQSANSMTINIAEQVVTF